MHYGLGSDKTTKAAARQRLVKASKAGKLKVPRPILDIEKRFKEDYHKRSGQDRRSRTRKKEVPTVASNHNRGFDIGYIGYTDQEIEGKEADRWDSFRAGDIDAKSHMWEGDTWWEERWQ